MRVFMDMIRRWGPVRLMVEYGNSRASNYAAGLAFNGFMTMFPLLAGLVAVFGFALQWDPSVRDQAQRALFDFLPTGSISASQLDGITRNAGTIGIVSLLALAWTGTGFFASMEFALDEIYRCKQRDMLHQRLMGLAMMGIFIVAILVSVVANSAMAFVAFIPFLGFVVGWLVMVALFAAIYFVVPNRTQSWRDALPGAFLAGLLVELLTLFFPLYLRMSHGFNSYGSGFALFLLLATWLYFLSQAILLGAVLNEMRLGRVPEPETGAVVAVTEDGEGARTKVKTSRRTDVTA